MDLAQDKLDLIEKIIKSDRKYSNNEDLFEDFFSETCRRSLGIIEVVSSNKALEGYIKKIATTSILNVLKDSGRLKRTKNGYLPIMEVPADENVLNDYSDSLISYSNFNSSFNPEELVVQNDIIKRVSAILIKIDDSEPEKQYLKIYKLRYDLGMTQKEISEELGLSQSEVSKRLFKLMKRVKESFES